MFLSRVYRQALQLCATRKYARFMHAESGKCAINNVELYYEKVGDGRKVLLCLPGALGSTRSDFGPQLDALTKDFTLVAIDPRGYGKSIPPKRDFPLNFFHRDVEDAVGLMKQLGIFQSLRLHLSFEVCF